MNQGLLQSTFFRSVVFILFLFNFQFCQGQNTEEENESNTNITLSISPKVDTTDEINTLILNHLRLFLDTKNDHFNTEYNWFNSNSGKFKMTSQALFKIENSVTYGANYYQPCLMELVHLYTNKLFPARNQLLDEGLATLIGGSGDYDYGWHRQKLQDYIKDQSVSFLENSRSAFERNYIDEVTSIPYMTGALICEYILDNYGKQKLFELFDTEGTDLFDLLSEVGINKTNFDQTLEAQLGKTAPAPLF